MHQVQFDGRVMPISPFVRVLRYSGLRIRDVVTLRRDHLTGNSLFLRTAKTGVQVRVPLPPATLDALKAVSNEGDYYFWSSNGDPKTRVGNYQRVLYKIFKAANIVHGHAHRFRHTFAVELLLAGVPIERVAVLLGHQNIRVTQKHYAGWTQARQQQLDEDVRKTWV